MAKGGSRKKQTDNKKVVAMRPETEKGASAKAKSADKVERSPLDLFKWSLAVALVLGGAYANMHYASTALGVRAAIGIVLLLVVLALAAWTTSGRRAIGFIKSSRTEFRKVVWPTRQETLQTTLIVVIVVAVAALFLWGLDSLLLWAVGWITGQRG